MVGEKTAQNDPNSKGATKLGETPTLSLTAPLTNMPLPNTKTEITAVQEISQTENNGADKNGG